MGQLQLLFMMPGLKRIVAYALSALLIWMSAIAGLVPAALAQSVPQSAPHAAHSHHNDMHHGTGHGVVPAPAHTADFTDYGAESDPRRCLSECLTRIADKLVPLASGAANGSDQKTVVVKYHDLENTAERPITRMIRQWPTGPPAGGLSAGSGASRLVAMNSRLRI